MEKEQILSICIPIYNRKLYLERMLERFLEDKDLFNNSVQLFISDNCSTDNLVEIVDYYREKGLNVSYHRNDSNLGMDGNFENCFRNATGKYTWLLGSDDIPVSGFLAELVETLSKNEFGLLFLKGSSKDNSLKLYNSSERLLVDLSHWITYISSNIVRTDYIRDFDTNKYKNTYLLQVPLYIVACLRGSVNGILFKDKDLFEDNRDILSGYNLYEVFITNFLGIYNDFVNDGLLSRINYNRIKKVLFIKFICPLSVRYLIFKEKTLLKLDNAWSIIFKHYGTKPYAYLYTIIWIFWVLMKRVLKRA